MSAGLSRQGTGPCHRGSKKVTMTQDFDLTWLSFSHGTWMLTEVMGINEATQGSQPSHTQHLPNADAPSVSRKKNSPQNLPHASYINTMS